MGRAGGAWGTVWITGASSGIGRELALLVESEGRCAHVAVSARSKDGLEALAGAADANRAFPVDVTDAGAVADCVAGIEREAGPIDLAVLNAGTWALMDTDAFDLAAVRKGVEVNLMGVMNALDALLPRMIERRSGHIAIVASVAGYRGLPKSAAYGPTKAALINLSETLKAELAQHGITVSVINPGFVDTPMTRGNPFPMPGIISARKAAEEILSGLTRGRFEIAFPRGFVFGMKLLKILPAWLYFPFIRRFIMRRS
jgi:short-subunit dehydrogenase